MMKNLIYFPRDLDEPDMTDEEIQNEDIIQCPQCGEEYDGYTTEHICFDGKLDD